MQSSPQYPEQAPEEHKARISLSPSMRRALWQGQVEPAFWTISSLISLCVNIILIAALVLIGRELFTIKRLVSEQFIGGLHENFIRMDQANIKTTIKVVDTIQVVDSIPVVFDLPLNQATQVVLTKNTPVKNATIYLNGAAVPLDIILKQGTALDIQLNMTIPVSQTVPVILDVPVELDVPVNIPLRETELHEPFVGLQQVVAPYDRLLAPVPNSWRETPLCGDLTMWFCNWFFGEK
jgi:hypothetical protein